MITINPTDKEKELLDVIQNIININHYSVKNISGGFSKAEIIIYNDIHIVVKEEYGVQSDAEDHVYVSHFTIDRKTERIL